MSLTLSIREAFKQRARYTFHSQMIGGLAPYHYEQASQEQPPCQASCCWFLQYEQAILILRVLKCARRSVMQQLQLKMMDDETQIINNNNSKNLMASSHGAPLFLRSTAETKLEINDNIMIRLAATSSTTTKTINEINTT